MKKIILTLVTLFALGSIAYSQNFNDIYKSYKNVEGIERVKVSPFLFKTAKSILSVATMFDSDMTDEDKQALKLLKHIDGFQLINATKKDIDFRSELEKTAFFEKNDYKLILETSNAEQDVCLYSMASKKDFLKDLIIITREKSTKNSLLAYIKGKINPNDISKLIAMAQEKSKE